MLDRRVNEARLRVGFGVGLLEEEREDRWMLDVGFWRLVFGDWCLDTILD